MGVFSKFQEVDSVIETDFKGVPMTIKYIGKTEMQKRINSAQKTKWRRGVKEQELSEDLFIEKMLDVAVSWEMDAETFSSLTGLKYTGDNPKEDIPCDDEGKRLFFKHAYGWEDFLLGTIQDYQAAKKK